MVVATALPSPPMVNCSLGDEETWDSLDMEIHSPIPNLNRWVNWNLKLDTLMSMVYLGR